MLMTAQQTAAVFTHDRNLIVIAGAGSGKTRVLVERYLALLDHNPDWPLNALVAITFTRKAAQEMRDRVRLALEDRLRAAADDAARALWADRLASMDSARIDTIHALCGALLRANAAEAGLDPGFVVLDEVEARIMLDDALDTALQAALDDPAGAVQPLLEEYETASLRTALVDFAAGDLPAVPDDLMTRWQAAWDAHAAACLQAFCSSAVCVSAFAWTPVSGWPQVADKLLAVWDDVRDWQPTLYDGPLMQRLDALRGLAEGIKINVGSKGAWGGEDGLADAKAMLRDLREAARLALAEVGPALNPCDERAARLLPLWRWLAQQVQDAYRAAKQRHSALDFDDLERLTVRLFTEQPGVAARYRSAEFRHVLVDEFQDTNAAQWAIASALADPDTAGSLFLVGDQKQSIYAFRGADVSVFHGARARLGPQAEVALARSFRTHTPLVRAFNALFARILSRDPASPVYAYQTDLGEPMDAARDVPPGDGPFIDVLLVDKTGGDDKVNAGDARRWEAWEIARRIHAMVAAETPVFDRRTGANRPCDYGDFALLFQSMSNVTLYEDVFKALGLPFVTVAGRGYYDRQEVWDLLNLLRALHNPADHLALASALRSPLFGLSDDALLGLRLVSGDDGRPLALWDALDMTDSVPEDEHDLAAFARDCLRDLRALAGRVTISELLREALARTGFLATLTGLADGARRRANVEKLVEKAENSGRITLGAFSRYLSDLSAREVREGEAVLEAQGAVTLMTVHASKGLEFPVVALMDTTWSRGDRNKPPLLIDPDEGLACRARDPQADNELTDTFAYRRAQRKAQMREEAERRRLLYVAATRAQDYLLISGQIGQEKFKGWLDWLLDALEIGDELDTVGADGAVIARAWGAFGLRVARTMPDDDALAASTDSRCVWDEPPVRDGLALPGEAAAPPLLGQITVDPAARVRHLSVTQMMDLGAAEYDDICRRRFRRSVLHDAPDYVEPVARRRSDRRLVGEIVHEALRWWDPHDASLRDLLHNLAWEHGVVEDAERGYIVREAVRLLDNISASSIFAWLQDAPPERIYREVPFVFRSEARIIHGVVDLLFQRADGQWVVVDYKTSYVHGLSLRDHARRYHLQVGAYAQAVAVQLAQADMMPAGTLPEVYIHYIRHEQTVQVLPQEWQAALDMLEQQIGRVLTT